MGIQQKTKREFSAGGAVYHRGKKAWLVAKHSGYKKWTLPKGLIDKGESAEETALREVKEETGITAKIIGKIMPAERYVYTFEGKRVFKVVQYFLMEYQSGDIKDHDWEMEKVEWLPVDEAIGRLDFSSQKKLLRKAEVLLEEKG